MNHQMVSRSAAMLEASLDDELVALHVEQGRCYAFNASAKRIWSLIETPIGIDQLQAALMNEYDVDQATCARELEAVLNDLEQDGLVTRTAKT
jgi:hypothetical protein